MTAAVDDVLSLEVVGIDPRIVAANQLGKLVRQYGPECFRMAGTFAIHLNQGLSKYPEEAKTLAAALKYRSVEEIARRRGTADPATYLRSIALDLSRQAALDPDDAHWAVRTWHDALDVKTKGPAALVFTEEMGAKKLWVRRKPPPASIVLATGLLVGLASLVSGGTAEVINIRFQGPTLLESLIVEKPQLRLVSNDDDEMAPIPVPVETRTSWQRMAKLGPVGFILVGGASFLGGFCGWSLGGGTWRRLVKGCLFAAGMSAIGSVVVITTMHFGPLRMLLAMPVVGSLVHLGVLGTMVFGVCYRVAVNDRREEREDVFHLAMGGMIGAGANDVGLDDL